MEQSTAQRRLVKSPPELWAEVSSQAALGRHLAPFGEIRITRVEPETTVAWEGERASGTVQLEPAGWGTKVVITAAPVERAAEPGTATPTPREPQPHADRHNATAAHQPRDEPPQRTPQATPAPPPHTPPAPEPDPHRSGFFARLFRRRAAEPVTAYAPAPPDPGPPAPGPEPTPPDPDPAPTLRTADPAPELAPALASTQPAPALPEHEPERPPSARRPDTRSTEAILTDVLDDLGAAHHRPRNLS